MRHASIQSFIASNAGRLALSDGPLAVIMAEDGVELDSTVAHHLRLGFAHLLLLLPPGLDWRTGQELEADGPPARPGLCTVHPVTHDLHAEGALPAALNPLIEAAPGTWFYWGYSAEYLFYPFCESRPISALLSFHGEERRDAMHAFVIDLYAPDLGHHPSGVDRATAHLDRTGYFAQPRRNAQGKVMERQLEFYGGLRWRYEEHVPENRRQIGRIALFRAAPGLRMRADHSFSNEEYNTYACEWHNNLTAAVCSFRAAKALKANPGSTFAIPSFWWFAAEPFSWNSRQLMDLGLMEPGQWF